MRHLVYECTPPDCITITGDEGYIFIDKYREEDYKVEPEFKRFLEEQVGSIDFEYYANIPTTNDCPF